MRSGALPAVEPGEVDTANGLAGKKEIQMRYTMRAVARSLIAFALAAAGCASSSAESKKLPSVEDSRTITDSVTVVALNQDTRLITVQDKDGHKLKFKVGDMVRNLPQVEVGDILTITYSESIAVQVVKPTGAEPSLTVEAAAARAEPGQLPAGGVADSVTLTATIEAIDRQSSIVTLLGPGGEYQVVRVKNPAYLKNVVVGDQVVITYTEALVTYVEAPKK